MGWPRGAWTRVRARPMKVALPVVALVVAVAVVALIALTGGGRTPDTLRATLPQATEPSTDPTPSPAVTPADTPTPTPAATRSNSAPSPAAVTSPSAPTEPRFSSDLLLPTAYPDAVFGHGTEPIVQRGSFEQDGQPNDYGPQGSCFNRNEPGDVVYADGNHRWFRPIVDRTWTWPGPVWVAETLHRAPDPVTADAVLHRCADWTGTAPGGGQPDPSTATWKDLGDALGFIRRESYPTFTTYHAGARVGRDVVELTWRQTGSVSAASTIESVLRAAVAWRRGDQPAAATSAPDVQEPAAVAVLPELGRIWPLYDGANHVLDWTGDAVGAENGFRCTSESGSTEKTIDATGPEVTREWVAGDDDDVAVDFSLTVSRAAAPDEQTAAQQFADCRGPHGSADTGAGFGDDSFVVSTSGIDEAPALVFVRVGKVYYLIATALQGSDLTHVVNRILALEPRSS